MRRRNFLQWALGAVGIGAIGVPKAKTKTPTDTSLYFDEEKCKHGIEALEKYRYSGKSKWPIADDPDWLPIKNKNADRKWVRNPASTIPLTEEEDGRISHCIHNMIKQHHETMDRLYIKAIKNS